MLVPFLVRLRFREAQDHQAIEWWSQDRDLDNLSPEPLHQRMPLPRPLLAWLRSDETVTKSTQGIKNLRIKFNYLMTVFLPTGPHLYCNFHSRTLNQPYATFVSGNERRPSRVKPADLPSHTNSTCASVSLPSRLPLAHSEHGEDGCCRQEIRGTLLPLYLQPTRPKHVA